MKKQHYTYTCLDCGIIKTTFSFEPCKRCMTCSRKHNGKIVGKKRIKHEFDKKRYYHFCVSCHDVQVAKAHRATCYCSECSRIKSRRPKSRWTFDFETMDFIYIQITVSYLILRVCETCGDEKMTSRSNIGVKLCKKCSDSKRSNMNKTRREIIAIEKSKTQSGLENIKKEKILDAETLERRREQKRKSREKIKKSNLVGGIDGLCKVTVDFTKKEKIIIPIKSEDEMIKEWLKNNKVKVIV